MSDLLTVNITEIDDLPAAFFPDRSDVDRELFYPIAKISRSIDCMAGYFTSGSLAELARAITCYLESNEANILRLIVSPQLQKEDLRALEAGIKAKENLIPLLFSDFEVSEDSLKSNSLIALSYLVSAGRIEFKIAIKNSEASGIFHIKAFLFGTTFGEICISGSSNLTHGGLEENMEQLRLDRSWKNDDASTSCKQLRGLFDSLWSDEDDSWRTVSLNDKSISTLVNMHNEFESNFDDHTLSAILREKLLHENTRETLRVQRFEIPKWLNYESGEFAHQGDAVNAWERANYKGMLAIATGGGKTLTSLIAASKLQRKIGKLFVVILVPTTPLRIQWLKDVKDFLKNPINIEGVSKTERIALLKEAAKRLRYDLSAAEAVIMTNDTFKGSVSPVLERISSSVPIMLIADEVHNLGSLGFRNLNPNYFDYRLGLSATVERFDEEETNFLKDYFGGVIFEFSLGDAIGKCLVPYEYHAHKAYLTATEEDEFLELTQKINKLSYANNLSKEDPSAQRLEILRLKRRSIIEAASDKLRVFDRVFPKSKNDISKSLVFVSQKAPNQIKKAISILNDRRLEFHQVTQEETRSPKKYSDIVKSFSTGIYQVLISKRVLDEGFNVPQTETMYILASQTGERQWIQRLGRVLRLSPETGKIHARIHDFVIIPPSVGDKADPDFKSLINSEYRRVQFFTKYSKNGLESDGSYFVGEELANLLRKDDDYIP